VRAKFSSPSGWNLLSTQTDDFLLFVIKKVGTSAWGFFFLRLVHKPG
jgi:hypothetical protein